MTPATGRALPNHLCALLMPFGVDPSWKSMWLESRRPAALRSTRLSTSSWARRRCCAKASSMSRMPVGDAASASSDSDQRLAMRFAADHRRYNRNHIARGLLGRDFLERVIQVESPCPLRAFGPDIPQNAEQDNRERQDLRPQMSWEFREVPVPQHAQSWR